MNKSKKQIAVRYRNGSVPFVSYRGSASMVRQALEQIHGDLVALCGEYSWSLEGDCDKGYQIIARYPGGRFTEGSGRTPGSALRAFYAARAVLQAGYLGNWL